MGLYFDILRWTIPQCLDLDSIPTLKLLTAVEKRLHQAVSGCNIMYWDPILEGSWCPLSYITMTSPEHHGVANHRIYNCLFTLQLRNHESFVLLALCERNSPVTKWITAQRISNIESVSMSWRLMLKSARGQTKMGLNGHRAITEHRCGVPFARIMLHSKFQWLVHLCLTKVAKLQTTSAMHFLERKKMIFWFKCHWHVLLRAETTVHIYNSFS